MPRDGQSGGAQIICVGGSNGGYAAIQTNDVYAQLAYVPNLSPGLGQIEWTPEFHVPVGTLILSTGTRGIRFRNFLAGHAAVVSAALSELVEPPIQLGAGGQ